MIGRIGDALQKWKAQLPSGAGDLAHAQAQEEKKLAEVKAVLERLQRISVEPADDDARADATGEPVADPSPKHDGPRGWAGFRDPRLIAAAGAIVIFVVAGIAVREASDTPPAGNALNLGDDRDRYTAALPAPSSPPPESAPASVSVPSRLAEVEKMIESGKVREARRLLLDLPASQSPDAALMLARSYDPNHLRTLPDPDAAPDAAEAERWYRFWHASAAARGLQMEPERLDRIIRAMR
jgi:hypothetical protein